MKTAHSTNELINTFYVLEYFKVWDRSLLNPFALVINTLALVLPQPQIIYNSNIFERFYENVFRILVYHL